MAPDAPSGAAPRDHVSRVRGAGPAGGRRRGHARGRRRASRLFTRAEPAKGIAALLRRRRACTSSIRCRTPVGKYRSARVPATAAGAARRRSRFDLIVCDFLFPAVNLPERLPCPAVIFTHNVESEIWRRHAETKATGARHDCSTAMQYRRMLRFEATDARGASTACSPCRTPTATPSPRSIRAPIRRAGPRRADRRGHRLLLARRRATRSRRDRSSSPARWTGCRTKTRCSSSVATSCRSSAPRSPTSRLSIVGRAPTPAVQTARRRARHPRHGPRGRRAAVHAGARRCTSCRCGSAAARG